MNPRFRYRLYILTLLILTGTGVLLSRLYNMQIEKQEYYKQKIPSNSTVTVREPGVRGEIFDRNGVKLATNSQSYIVYFNLAEVRKAYVEKHGNSLTRKNLVNRKGAKKLEDRVDIPGMVNELIIQPLAKHGLAVKYSAQAMDAHYLTHGGLVPFVYRKNLTFDEFATFAEQNLDLPGVYISASPLRVYPYGSLCSHVLGFIKVWKKGDIPKGFLHYIGDPFGADGIEKSMNDVMTGREGLKKILKDEKGKTIRLIDYQPPAQGSDVYLTIDSEIQYLTETVLLNTGKAAAVVMDCRTGEVLAMASVPNYDPNNFIPAITNKNWAYYRDNTAAPLINRAITNFAPGSTFKLAAAVAGAKYGLDNMSCNCPGYTMYGKIKIRCHKHSGHGILHLKKAIQVSCNPYFQKICNNLGYKKIVEVYTMLGLGQKTGIRLPGEHSGIVPGSPRWKQRNKGKSMTPAFTGMMGIGQGFCEATPLQMACVVSTIANGGKFYEPRIVSKVSNTLTRKQQDYLTKTKVDLVKEGVRPEYLAHIREGMKLAADKGTARRAKPKDIEIGAKTGTAQTSDQGIKTHVAWTAAFAPYDNPRYVVVVAVKRGGSGGKVAGPIVRTIIQGLIEKEQGKHFRVVRTKPYAGSQKLIEEVTIGEDPFAGLTIDEGETGDEAEDAGVTPTSSPTDPDSPKPSIAPEADRRGSQQNPNNP